MKNVCVVRVSAPAGLAELTGSTPSSPSAFQRFSPPQDYPSPTPWACVVFCAYVRLALRATKTPQNIIMEGGL